MTKDRTYKSIEALRDQIDSKIDLLIQGACSLQEMETLLNDIRALEERVIVIRYKAIERLNEPEEVIEQERDAPETPKVEEPELPLNNDDQESKQISLIDSIEELSSEVSVNQNHSSNSSPSLAERLEAEPISSIMKALNVNQKMGLVNQVFKGDDGKFRSTIEEMDRSSDKAGALNHLDSSISGAVDADHTLIVELKELVERRFL